jgi:hypothetical protein
MERVGTAITAKKLSFATARCTILVIILEDIKVSRW